MVMKKNLIRMGLALAILAPVSARADLTGIVKLACEAVLCLSSGTQPAACAPSLAHYFGIDGEDMFSDRLDFLNLCPTSSAPNMPSLVNAIVKAAGRCDAAQLNRRTKIVQVPNKCNQFMQTNSCGTHDVVVIDNSFPQYCTAYYTHAYVKDAAHVPVYVGAPIDGGRWQ